jgi:N-methylhydantoinase B
MAETFADRPAASGGMDPADLDPFQFEVFYHRLFDALSEARDVVRQLAFSQISREVGEVAEGVFLPGGEVSLLSPGLLLHLNTVTRTIRYMHDHRFAEDVGYDEGDQFLCNDPDVAAMHRMDMALAAPLYYEGQMVGWVGNYSHVPEIGATEPGGHPMIATDAYHEGICLTPIKIVEKGKLRRELMDMLTRVVRDPRAIELDTKAKIAANERAKERILAIIDDVGLDFYLAALQKLIDDAESKSRTLVKRRVRGRYRGRVFTDYKLPDRPGLRTVEIELEFEEDGTIAVRAPVVSPQAAGSYNCPLPCFEGNLFCVALGHMLYDTRWNSGVVRVHRTDIPYRSMINADPEASVHFGTVGTGLHSATCVTSALSRAAFVCGEAQDVISPSGPVNQLMYGGIDQFGRRSGRYVMDAVSTGGGALIARDGTDVGVHQINPWISCGDVEATEAVGPILQFGRRRAIDNGAFGRQRGGAASNTVLTFEGTPSMKLGNMAQGYYVSAISGLYGGYPPPASRFITIRGAKVLEAGNVPHDVDELLSYRPDIAENGYNGSPYLPIEPGDLVGQTYWGGAGLGDPLGREPEAVAHDIDEQVLRHDSAARVYGVVVDPGSREVDLEKTAELRARRKAERLAAGVPGREYVQRLVERRERRDLPEPVLEMIDELLATDWSDGFRGELDREKSFAAGEGVTSFSIGDDRRTVLPLTPDVDVVEDGHGVLATVCAECGHVYGRAEENFKWFCSIYDRDPGEIYGDFAPDPDWMVYREFYCPGCGIQVEVEAVPPGMPILHDVEIDWVAMQSAVNEKRG